MVRYGYPAMIFGIAMALILMSSITAAENEEEKDYIAQPANIPLLSSFHTPQLEPGETGILNFSLTNRYRMEMTNATITVDIYRCARIDESQNISEISHPPAFQRSGEQTVEQRWDTIESNATKTDGIFSIETNSGTKPGTYFVRIQLTFDYNGTSYLMRSRGYFTDEEWDHATTNTTIDDPGNINITRLGVDGILPDTSFGVRDEESWVIPGFHVVSIIFVFVMISVVHLKKRS